MTATLVAKNVAGGFAHRTLFEGLDLTVAPGDVVGVVGANGAGKKHTPANPGRRPRATGRHSQSRPALQKVRLDHCWAVDNGRVAPAQP